MALKHKTHDVERIAVVQRARKPAVRTENEHQQVSHPSGALERIVTKAPAALRPADILALQRTVGNRAVQRMLSNQPHSLSSPPSTTSYAIQRKTKEEEPLQRKSETAPRPENGTGLPNELKAGLENISGMPMHDVKVHYNSLKPAEFQALAYTQGADIHLGPGQEKHLSHEAWHVVQQRQGRVKPTLQMKGVEISDDPGLEKEADVMGDRATRSGNVSLQKKDDNAAGRLPRLLQRYRAAASNTAVMQLKKCAPVYTGGDHGTKVTLDMDKGDTLDAGSKPSAAIDGWDSLIKLGLLQGADNWHKWIKFHMLNEKAGGSGADKGNLTPATQVANHHTDWNKFENTLKGFVDPTLNFGLMPDKVSFQADVGYFGSETIYWRKTDKSDTATTDSSHYPNSIAAKLNVTYKAVWGNDPKSYTASLDGSKGLIKPQGLKTVPGWDAYSDAGYTIKIVGTAG